MTAQTPAVLKTYFETGDRPTAAQYTDLIDTACGYKKYVAILSLTIEDGFQANVLENTLGGSVVWTSSGDGVYIGTLSNGMTFGKTIVTPVLFSSATDDPIVSLVTAIKPQDNNAVQVFSTENGAQVPLGYYVPIEIRVYP